MLLNVIITFIACSYAAVSVVVYTEATHSTLCTISFKCNKSYFILCLINENVRKWYAQRSNSKFELFSLSDLHNGIPKCSK